MPKQLNQIQVGIGVSADTSQAKKQLQDLQNTLSKLGTNINGKLGENISKEIQQATSDAAKLKVQLQEATNVNTGTLDLSKFKQSLDQSGMSLEKYKNSLQALGTDGTAAFNQLANAIISSEMPLKRTNALMDQFWTALKNTARWQISSSALHGLMSAVQGAYGYAQDLNKSLSSIAIVTHNSVANMRDFAEQANKSAQALSTSTLAYTDAALIYYQQGLADEDVAERVQTTLKLSNVTGESAEEVSSYMTAIWNNFRTGSESIESFADKITALGAATAASSEEIANGLQQFSAVADTVGLSYDYAASALATVVAQTRQSASTVGNAFRTIFSRLEGLKLGDTLEDGTDLNKYSGALQTIGVSIKDQNGELKEMDTILEEIGSRWQTLSRDQQVALAQTVGGVRQYANLIALFDNWDKFQENLSISRGAEGELEEQAKIYEESWEAAQKRVRAAWQAIYQDLIDDKFFISLLDGIKDILNGVENIIGALGGLPGLLSTILAIVLQLKGAEIGRGLSNLLYNFMPASVKAQDEQRMKEEALARQREMLPAEDGTETTKAIRQNQESTIRINEQILANKRQLTEEERERLKILIDQNRAIQEQNKATAEQLDKAEQSQSESLVAMSMTARRSDSFKADNGKDYYETVNQYQDYLEKFNKYQAEGKNSIIVNSMLTSIEEKLMTSYGLTDAQLEKLGVSTERIRQLREQQKQGNISLENSEHGIASALQEGAVAIQSFGQSLVQITQVLSSITMAINAFKGIWDTIQNPNLSTWQKFTSVIMSLGMAFRLLSNMHALEAAKSVANTAKTTVNTIAKLANAAASKKQAQANRENAVSMDEENKVLGKNTLSNVAKNVSNFTKGFSKTFKDMGGFKSLLKPNTEALKQFSAGLGEGGATATEFGGSVAVLLPFLIKLLAILAALYISIKVLDAVIETSDERIQKAQKNLDKMNEALTKASNEASKAESAFKNLVDTLDGLEDKKQAIEELEEGTAEWRNAISESNNALIEALDNANQLGKIQIQYDNKGLAYLTETDQKIVKEAAEREAHFTRMQKTLAQMNVYSAKQDLAIAQDYKDYNKSYWNDNTSQNMLFRGAMVNTNALFQDFADSISEKLGGESQYSRFEEMAKALAETTYAGNKDLFDILQKGEETPDILKDILAKYPELATDKNLCEAISEAANTIATYNPENLGTQLGQEYFSQSQFDDVDSSYKNYMSSNGVIGKELEDSYQKIYDGFYTGWSKFWGDPKLSNEAKDKIAQLYREANSEAYYDEATHKLYDQMGGTEIDINSLSSWAAARQAVQGYNFTDDNYIANQNAAWAKDAEEAYQKVFDVFGKNGTLDLGDSKEEFEKRLNFVMTADEKELEKYGGFEGLNEKLDKLGEEHEVPLKIQASDFTQNKSSVKDEDIMKEVEQFADFIENNLDSIKGLNEHLKDCRSEVEGLAYGIMRFDDAIQDVTENYEDWNAALAAGGMRAASVMDDLAKAYGNVLDVDNTLFSGDFLNKAENLDLMKQAIEGTAGAYEQLQMAAAQDYLTNSLNLGSQAANDFMSVIGQLQDEINALEVGELLDPSDFQPIYDALNELLRTTEMSVDEFNALTSLLGFNADVKTADHVTEDEGEAVDLKAEPYETGGEVQIPMLESSAETGTPQTFGIPLQGVKVSGNRHPVDGAKKSTKVVAVEIDTSDGKGLRKKAGGQIKYQNATHGGGGVSPSKGSGGKGGGGGGGSKKKTTKDPIKKKFEEDRYHNIKSAINEVAKALERVNKLKDRAYGKAKLKYMDQEIAKLKDQVRLQNEYIKQAETYLKMDRAKLEGLGMGAQFTDEGRLINYEQVLSNLVDTYNNAVDARNAAAEAFNNSAQEDADNEAFEAAEKQLKKAEETYSEQKKILDQYEKTYDTLQDQIDKRTELLNEIYDAKLAKVVYKVDIQIEVNDADIKYLEWLNKFLEKNLDNAEDIMANLSKAAQRTFKDIEAINQGLTELFANHDIQLDFDNMDPGSLVKQLQDFMEKEGLGSEITEAEAQQIRDWNDKLMDYMDKWVAYWDKTHEMIDKVFEDYTKNVDREIDKMDAYTKLLDHYLKMLDLTGADRLGFSTKDILNVYDTRIKNEQNILSSLVTERKALEDTLLDYQKNLSQAETEEAKQYWEEHVKNAEDALQDVKDKVISATESTLEAVNERLEKAMELAEKQFKKRFDNLDLLMERFSRQQELDHLYLDDYEKYYELNKSAKELQKAIEDTNNAMMRGKFKELQDKINASMSSGVKLSQTQTDIIAKRVELLKAEDELLNARNAKNTVRMTRDNEGNYSYTYTADQDMIDDAELNYNEKFYQLMNAERSGQEELQSQRLDYLNNYTSVSQDLMNKLQTGAISQDQYDEAMAELQDQFQEYMDYYLEQLQFLYDEQATLRDDDLVNAQELTELKLANYDDFITQYEDTILGRLFDDVSSEEEFTRLALEAMAQYHQENAEALNVWEGEVATTYEAAGLDVDNFRDTVNADLADIDQKSEETKQKITEMTDKMREDMQAVMEKALAMDQDWAQRMRSMRDQISQTVDSLNKMLEKLADVSGGFGYSGEAAVFAGAKYLEAGKDADVATKAFEAMEKAARAAEQAAKDALRAMKEVENYDPPTSTYVGGGCFDPGTKITMFDGSLKNIEEIKVGDIVLSYNELTKEYLPQKVNDVMVHHNTIQLLDVYFSNDLHLGLTACHPILTTSGWKSLNYEVALLEHWIETTPLEIGQQVINILNSDIFITDIVWRKDIENYDTYNISVENIHTYIANGIVVHNAHDKISAFATGGYTGSWGSEGHLAMLHEKEIVLNKSDTSNMLNIVGMVRDLTSKVDLNHGLSAFTQSIMNSSDLAFTGTDQLQQEVHIEANFPNVETHNEIEMAFNNLINSATQYVNRK